jgi:GNAT superfamily N-acetyltransferase
MGVEDEGYNDGQEASPSTAQAVRAPEHTTQITAVPATAENFTDEHIIKLMRQFCTDTFNPAGRIEEATRSKIAQSLIQTSDAELMDGGLAISPDLEGDEEAHFRAFSQDIQRNVAKMRRIADQGNVELAMEGSEIVGAIAVRIGGKMPDNRNVYEFTEAVVLPGHRGRGIYTQLKKSLTARLRTKYPNTPFMSVTEKPAIIRYCDNEGWEDVGMDFCEEVVLRRDELKSGPARAGTQEWFADKKAKDNWEGWVDDPLRN